MKRADAVSELLQEPMQIVAWRQPSFIMLAGEFQQVPATQRAMFEEVGRVVVETTIRASFAAANLGAPRSTTVFNYLLDDALGQDSVALVVDGRKRASPDSVRLARLGMHQALEGQSSYLEALAADFGFERPGLAAIAGERLFVPPPNLPPNQPWVPSISPLPINI